MHDPNTIDGYEKNLEVAMQIAESAALLAAAVGTVMLGAGSAEAKSLDFEQTFGKFSERVDASPADGCDVVSLDSLSPSSMGNMVIMPISRPNVTCTTLPRRRNPRAVAVQHDKSNLNLHLNDHHHHGGLGVNRDDD
ncbi:hypothetical protein OG417_10440 [Actinoallomurus sp. NBC_01490]|jgi:hypothetical protein|uniref:hypothetical protein n=1 Tax=Actinoallomurus sp. NBC_01490 TaxID=2903557 RepID=UPI002E37BAEA|nr:hypothetical protein [Actinoallomurus sp. NBC_01490]